MKVKTLLFSVALCVSYGAWAQTSYGNLQQGNAGNGGGVTNSFFGHLTGAVTTGVNNTLMGYQSGLNNTTGYENSSLGARTLENNTTGSRNTANGVFTLFGNTIGIENTAVGYAALGFNATGNGNTATGYQALLNTNNSNNTALGYQSGATNTLGANNTYIGVRSGYTNETGSGNVFLGNEAGYNELGSNRLYVDNSNTSSPLIWGDFTNDILSFNGIVTIGTNQTAVAGYHLTVGGDIIAEKVKVAVNGSANWSDYVFEEDYTLKPLAEVEAFIKENKHLPNVPSAAEMVKSGLDVAKMDAKLLEKIEELTLYLIEIKKEVTALKKENAALKAAITNPEK